MRNSRLINQQERRLDFIEAILSEPYIHDIVYFPDQLPFEINTNIVFKTRKIIIYGTEKDNFLIICDRKN